jgi:hypothetical protein
MRSNAEKMFWAIVMEGALLTTAGVACSSGDSSDAGTDSGAEGDTDTDTDTDTSSNEECPSDCDADEYSMSGEGDWASCSISGDPETSDTCCWTSDECCTLCCENW